MASISLLASKLVFFLYDEPNKGFKVCADSLILSLGMGDERKRQSLSFTLKEAHLLKNQEIRSLRIVKQGGIYYAVFTVQMVLPEKKPIRAHLLSIQTIKTWLMESTQKGTLSKLQLRIG